MVVLVAAGVAFTATPASAAPFSCELAGFAAAGVDLPIAASGPATVVVGETNRYNLDLSFAGVIPEQFATISGVANSAEATLKLPSGIQVDPATATATGVDGATVTIAGDQAAVKVPGPIPFGGDAALPALTVSIDVTATQAGQIVVTTEGATVVLDAEVTLTPETEPLAIVATCQAAAPETLLTVSASDVAGATQTAAPNVQTSSATETPAAMATTGSESVVLSGVALILLGFGMLAVAGQRVLGYRRS
ncbi:MAG: hypothetical protein ACERLM_15910 [Acidimicrobiales bacterium]